MLTPEQEIARFFRIAGYYLEYFYDTFLIDCRISCYNVKLQYLYWKQARHLRKKERDEPKG